MYSMDQTQQASFGAGVQQLNQNQNFGISSIPSNQSQRSQPKAPVAINASPQIQQRVPNPTNQFQASLVQRLPNLPTLPRLPNLPTLPRLPNFPATAALTGQDRRQTGLQAGAQAGGQAGTQAGGQAGAQASSQTGSQGAGRQVGSQGAGGQAGRQAGTQAAVAAQNRKQQLKQQRQEAKNQSLQLPQVKSVGDYIARRNRMVMGGNTCSHEYRFLTQMLQEVDFIKRLYAQQVPLSISEVFIWKTTRMEVAHNLVTKYEAFSDIVIYVICVIYVIYVTYVICVICVICVIGVIYVVDVIFFIFVVNIVIFFDKILTKIQTALFHLVNNLQIITKNSKK